jgi:hypothetical protein
MMRKYNKIKNHLKIKRNNTKFILIIAIVLEIIVLIGNISYVYKYELNFQFRNIDEFLLNSLSKTYNEISQFLYKKFHIKNNTSINEGLYNKTSNEIIKTVKVCRKNIHPRWISLISKDLEGLINIEMDEDNPDYLIYATFGCENTLNKYNNTIKIAFFTENQLPDLNFADYAIGLGHINHLDRFFTFPYFVYELTKRNINIKDFEIIRNEVLNSRKREKFCAAVITNPIGFRLYFIKELNKYKNIDMGGRFHNNIGGHVKDKIEFLKQYKFSLAMENSEADGYTSEKIIDAYLAGTIPIYYGDYMVDDYINPKTYILIRSQRDMANKINYIKRIDNDDNLYRSILKEKVFIDDFFVDNIQNERKKFLLHIFEQKKEYAKRVDRYHFDYRDN